MKVEEKNLTGIVFRSVETTRLRFERGPLPSESASWPELLPNLLLTVRSGISDDRSSCEVFLGCEFSGAEDWELAAEVRGAFAIPEGRESVVDIEEFTERHALVVLFPFLREAVASATASSNLGALLMPPINVLSLVEGEKEETEAEA